MQYRGAEPRLASRAEFARRLQLLLHEPDLRKLWRQWAAEEMPKYSYEAVVDQYLEVYDLAIKRHKENAQA